MDGNTVLTFLQEIIRAEMEESVISVLGRRFLVHLTMIFHQSSIVCLNLKWLTYSISIMITHAHRPQGIIISYCNDVKVTEEKRLDKLNDE